MDEHRIGLQPIVRRVWAPRGQRPVALVQPRYRWRYLSGFVHPLSGRTQWHLASTVNLALFSASLAAFAEQVGAGPEREVALLLDGAGWHRSSRLTLPDHLHLLPLPPYSPELQPAERLWRYSNTPLINAHFADLEALDDAQLARCSALQTDPSLMATIQAATHFHWWPADYSPIT
jgi:hypothetical protein